ncbi:MAG: M67 family metallopeptidase [bacterium]
MIKQKFIDQLINHAKKGYPEEVCGIIAGKEGSVLKIYEMANVSKTPETFYFMEPEEQFKVLKDIRNSGIEMLGIYHSHPASKAHPSEEDCRMCFYPDAFYMIISLKDFDKPEIGVFRVNGENITEERVDIK